MIPNKKHADFQDSYRRSSNFNRTVPKEDLEIKGDGKVSLKRRRLDEFSDSQKKDMVKSMDRFRERTGRLR